MIFPVPKPRKAAKPKSEPKARRRLRPRNAKRQGRAFGASHVDREYMAWIGSLPCAVCKALGVEQTTRTEVEHFVLRSQGGYDRGDTYPTCATHRELRHGTMGPKAFTRMLQRVGFDERKLCANLVTIYEAERWPCP